MLHSRHLRGSGGFRVLFFLPYVIPFVAGVLIWRDMLNVDSGWVNGFLRVIGIGKPPDWLQDPTWIYSGLVIMGIWGDRGRDHRLPGRPQGHPDRALRRRPDRRRGRLGTRSATITIPMISPVIFYTLVLARRRGAPVLPRPARAQERDR